MEEANLKRLHTIWFEWYDISEKVNLERQISVIVRDRPGKGERWIDEPTEAFYGTENTIWYHNDGHMSPCAVLVTQSCPTVCNPWTVTCQVPPSMVFSRQKYWRGLPCPPPGDLLNPGIKPEYPAATALQVDSFVEWRPAQCLRRGP